MERTAMRIGLLTTSFPTHDDPVAGTFVLGFARTLASQGHSVHVLAPEPAQPSAALDAPGVTVEQLPYLRPRALQRTFYGAGVPDNLRRDPRAWLGLVPFTLALELACRARAPSWDALVSHWVLPCGLIAGRVRAQRPHLAVMHSADLYLLERLPGRALLAAQIADGATRLWFLSESQRERFCALLPAAQRARVAARAHVSPMGIELEVADAPRTAATRAEARRALNLSRPCLLSMGRLVPVKGLDVLIEALAQQPLTLLVAGAGPERARLAQLARERGVDARFLGTVTGAAKQQLFAAADAFVLPSRVLSSGRSEGVPTALLEALAHGLPVVASEVGELASVIRPEDDVLLVPAERPQALRDAIAQCLARPSADSTPPPASSRFAWPAMAASIEALLRA